MVIWKKGESFIKKRNIEDIKRHQIKTENCDSSTTETINDNPTFSEQRVTYKNNGLSWFEANINAIATKLVEHDNKKISSRVVDAVFGIFKRLSSTYESIEKQHKKNDIVKRYVKRCDSLVKKAGFLLSVLVGPIKFAAVCLTVLVCAHTVISSATYDVVLGVYTDGTLVGYLDSKNAMTSAKSALESDISSIVQCDYSLKCDIEYSFLNVKNPTLLNDADCYRILYTIASNDLTDAYALYIDGEFVAAGADFDKINSLINDLVDSEGESTVSIKNDIGVTSQLCLKTSVKSNDEIARLLEFEIEENEREVEATAAAVRVEAAESIHADADSPSALEIGIARFSDGVTRLTMPQTLSDGTKITTDKDELMRELDLVYVKNEEIIESIPYETTYIESDDYYVGTQMLKTTGREGSAKVVYEVEYDKNGEISRNAVSKTTIREPVTEVMVIGTSKVPTSNPSGNLIWPTDVPKGISSYYGGRELFGSYDFHLGIDILNGYGNDIWAADSGEVTYAGYNSSYGYYVTIEHSDGLSTLYAHMSKLYTQKGDTVKQGDVIGAVGKTGVATAYHLHFEVRIDGKTVDPLDYLPERE